MWLYADSLSYNENLVFELSSGYIQIPFRKMQCGSDGREGQIGRVVVWASGLEHSVKHKAELQEAIEKMAPIAGTRQSEVAGEENLLKMQCMLCF